MSGKMKKVIFASMGISALVAVVCIVDLVMGIPFSGQSTMDIMFIISAALIGYMGWDTLKEMG